MAGQQEAEREVSGALSDQALPSSGAFSYKPHQWANPSNGYHTLSPQKPPPMST